VAATPGWDEAYRAIGHYVATFSMLISDMRGGIEWALGSEEPGNDPMIARLTLGEASASQITNAYFAICEQSADLDDEEHQVAVRLKKEVNDVIKERNDFAHGDWDLGEAHSFDDPRLVRTKPGRRAGPFVERVYPVDEIDALAEAMSDLDGYVVEFGWLCFGIYPLTRYRGMDVRVRDIFRFERKKHRILREGRYVDIPWFDEDD
jgi:hypothetical protein